MKTEAKATAHITTYFTTIVSPHSSMKKKKNQKVLLHYYCPITKVPRALRLSINPSTLKTSYDDISKELYICLYWYFFLSASILTYLCFLRWSNVLEMTFSGQFIRFSIFVERHQEYNFYDRERVNVYSHTLST